MGAQELSFAERRDWLRLSRSENVGPRTFKALIERFDDVGAALDALPELSAKGGLRRSIRIYSREQAEADLEQADLIGARYVAWCEPDYPALLPEIDSAPPILCLKGNAALARRPAIAIVGSRNASASGRKFARRIAGELGDAGFSIVSGLARGIDTAAHEGSLQGGTVAVLAGGIDNIYPRENTDLYQAIAQDGLLVAEHPVGTRPTEKHFPRRNRLVSGMSYGVLVVEAALRSGSLITARLALEQNREVFAVPGSPLDPRAEGTNSLIKKGAALVETADDVIQALSPFVERVERDSASRFCAPDSAPLIAAAPTPGDRTALLDLIGHTAIDIDDLIRESGAEAAMVMTALLELELAGEIERLPRQQVVRLSG